MSSQEAINEIDYLTDRFVIDLGIKSHKELKRVGEFKRLPEISQKKIYEKVRYQTKKSNLKLVEDSIEEHLDQFQNRGRSMSKFNIKILSTIFLLTFIFFFLASESIRFYDQFEILPLFKFSIPLIIELAVLTLSFKNSNFARMLLGALIIFNTGTFVYKTIECDKNIQRQKEISFSRKNFLFNQKNALNKEIEETKKDISNLKNQHSELISKNYFKIANGNLIERINKKEEDLKALQNKYDSNNLEILKLGLVQNVRNGLSIDTFFMISLKCILQAIFVFLIFDLKSIGEKGEHHEF